MSGLMRLQGGAAVVTGAASGIGRAIAVGLARRGCDLALADLDGAGLEQTSEQVAAHDVRVSLHVMSVADPDAVSALPAQVAAAHGRVHLLVNNAGVALGGRFDQVAPADFEWLFGVNFWGVVNMTRAFLPLLQAAGEARVVNLSSLFGIIAPPGQAAYAASKYAVRGFSDALRHELEGSGVGVTTVHPGGVATSIAASARMPAGMSAREAARRVRGFQSFLRLPPERAGEIIVRGIERRRARILVGRDAMAAALAERLAPVSYWRLIGGRLGG